VPELAEVASEKDQDSRSQISRISRRSNTTQKTYVTQLERQLNEEKEARLKLEKELEELRKMSQDIAASLKTKK